MEICFRLAGLVTILFSSILSILTPAQAADDEALTRNVALQNAASGKQLTINQVDTSQFPAVNIFATVLSGGEPVAGLTDTDFRVREDEVDQEPLKVIPRLSPLSVVVTIDTSGSMSKAIGQTKEAAKSFLDSLDANDNVMTVGFARSVTPLSNFSTDKSTGKSAIDTVTARGDTALYDALYASVESVKGRAGRKAVALLSDGVDDDGSGKQLSKHTVQEVLALAKEVNVPIFTIGLGSGIDKALLENIAKETGARFFNAPTVEELKVLYASLGKQLTGQYNILYTSNLPGDGSTHRVQLAHSGLTDMKEYLSPNNGTGVAVVKAPQAEVMPVAAKSSTVIEIEGGSDFDSAAEISAGVSYRSKKPEAKTAQFFKFKGTSGSFINVYAQQMGADYTKAILFDSNKKQLESGNAYSKWSTIPIEQSVSKESDELFYFVIETKDQSAFGLHFTPVGDAGQQGDAGGGQAGAIEIQEGTSYVGYVDHEGDKVDFYKIKVPAGMKMARARPAVNCRINLSVFNDDGKQLRKEYSQNEGAGVSLEFENKASGPIYLRVETGDKKLCPYVMVAGNPGLEAPTQPDSAAEFTAPNARQGL